MTIENDNQIISALTPVLEDVIDEVTDKMLEEYKNYIQKEVYDKYDPIMYDRQMENGGLKGLWDKKVYTVGHGIVNGEILPESGELTLDTESFIHGNPTRGDLRNYIASMIFEGTGYVFYSGPWNKPRDAWTPFIEDMKRGQLNNWIIEGFQKRGFKIAKTTQGGNFKLRED